MKKYTVETLKKENYHFDNVHGITEADVTKVNKIITMIEKLRLTGRVQVGDVVQYTNEYGDYFQHALIDDINDDVVICENGSMYIDIHEGEFYHSTSGGIFSLHNINDFTYIEKQQELSGHLDIMGCVQMVEFILPQLLICGNVMIIKRSIPQKHMINIICLIENQKMVITSILLMVAHMKQKKKCKRG